MRQDSATRRILGRYMKECETHVRRKWVSIFFWPPYQPLLKQNQDLFQVILRVILSENFALVRRRLCYDNLLDQRVQRFWGARKNRSHRNRVWPTVVRLQSSRYIFCSWRFLTPVLGKSCEHICPNVTGVDIQEATTCTATADSICSVSPVSLSNFEDVHWFQELRLNEPAIKSRTQTSGPAKWWTTNADAVSK